MARGSSLARRLRHRLPWLDDLQRVLLHNAFSPGTTPLSPATETHLPTAGYYLRAQVTHQPGTSYITVLGTEHYLVDARTPRPRPPLRWTYCP
ncbi:hypothetical protein DHEL01_v208853 [Diaporthe helianthi]|uniref:Uncharacterized protein n=1 Tax=Diaporthe helianthi TaxID=158607 RepID=A0A2P5HR77_DIAHE|nr:hypothetical protein DHEL01_v208853 [Diaporthe helianthi]